ncbi:acetyl-CoA carboxylase biotin carboxyl carrier protein subunit [Amycolatopsis sp.]|uniref:acetyl-CoA carboxylase biotin carboxyl carrier protein n=1 Tax=Amycolatopsis sp. TaxID=37632 RepID=UPI002B80F335|nr:acetyl-CoA carboxylase biotin carboxyl carrier protein subunit [Amycolatopsis sp.]HVV12550.1 acetyl-CoA carboxylase biotin carboxyl carrier protein subunit [Amycolatopsis sp.]
MSAAINEDVDHVLTVLREQVLALCAEASRAPSLVRVSTRDMVVEVEWTGDALPVLPAAPSIAAAEPVADQAAGTFPLCAGTVGVFYRAPEPGAAPFVAEGDTIRPGQQVAILEAMKLMIPVEADRAGRVVEVLVEDGTAVEHGQPLLLLAAA